MLPLYPRHSGLIGTELGHWHFLKAPQVTLTGSQDRRAENPRAPAEFWEEGTKNQGLADTS